MKNIWYIGIILIIGQQFLETASQVQAQNLGNQFKATSSINILNLHNKQHQKGTIIISSKPVNNEDNFESNLIGVVWQLQQISYNNDELIKVDNTSDYTIEFLANNQVQIKADCNRARGTYTVENSSISIKIGPTTRAMCPPESISDRYLKELESATIFFFQDGNLYFDLKFDTGTMKFISE